MSSRNKKKSKNKQKKKKKEKKSTGKKKSKSSSRKQTKRRKGSYSEGASRKNSYDRRSSRKGSYDGGNPGMSRKKTTKRKGMVKISDLVKNNLGLPAHMSEAVVLHHGTDYYEWLAGNTCDFLNEAVIIYSSIMEWCTKETCAVMSAGSKNTYKWVQPLQAKTSKTLTLCAPEYVDKFLEWAEKNLSDTKVLPVTVGKSFPRNLPGIIRAVFKHIFRMYAHIFLTHLGKVMEMGIDAYVNSSFKHFIHFAHEFQLMELQDYTPLKDLIKAIMDPSIDPDDEDEDEEKEDEEEKEKDEADKEEDEDKENDEEEDKDEADKDEAAEDPVDSDADDSDMGDIDLDGIDLDDDDDEVFDD